MQQRTIKRPINPCHAPPNLSTAVRSRVLNLRRPTKNPDAQSSRRLRAAGRSSDRSAEHNLGNETRNERRRRIWKAAAGASRRIWPARKAKNESNQARQLGARLAGPRHVAVTPRPPYPY